MSRVKPSTSNAAIGNGKRFDKDKSPFHLLFFMENRFMMKEFSCIEELAKFVKQLSLNWADYGILHGEMVKELPQKDIEEDLDDDIDEQPESGLQELDFNTAHVLLGNP